MGKKQYASEMTLKQYAKEIAGRQRHFECFVWHDSARYPNAWTDWGIIYDWNETSHDHEQVLAKTNRAEIRKRLSDIWPVSEGTGEFKCQDPMECDIIEIRHYHFCVNGLYGICIRVYKDGRITKTFKRYYEIQKSLEDYPILNEDAYSAMCDDESDRIMRSALDWNKMLFRDFDLTKDQLFDRFAIWLSDHDIYDTDRYEILHDMRYPPDDVLEKFAEFLREKQNGVSCV